MESTTRKIPANEWDLWKSTILNLRATTTLEDIATTMETTHGFKATPAQYEVKLKAWEHRKNLKREEWRIVLRKLDSLTLQGMKCRICISGQVVSNTRIETARRRYFKSDGLQRGAINARGPPDLRTVSIETRGRDGTWSTFLNLDEVDLQEFHDLEAVRTAHEPSLPETSLPEVSLPQTSFQEDGSTDDDGDPVDDDIFLNHGAEDDVVVDIPSTRLELSHTTVARRHEVDVTPEDSFPLETSSTISQSASNPLAWQLPVYQEYQELGPSHGFDLSRSPSSLIVSARSPYQPLSPNFFPDFALRLLDHLPFTYLKNELEDQGIYLSTRATNYVGVQSSLPSQHPFTLFLEDIRSTMPDEPESKLERPTLNVRLILSSLKSLLSGANFDYNISTSIDEMLPLRLNEALLRSMINGFSGLQDIPIHSVLKYLGRTKEMGSLLTTCLQTQRPHIGKALAENLFRASIENNDEAALRYLLDFVDVNAIICIINGQKYTPVERAASLQHLGLVRIFINARANVNKTFALNSSKGGALYRLAWATERRTRITPEIMDMVDWLLKADAKVYLDTIRGFLYATHSSKLTCHLFNLLEDSDHSEVMSDSFLSFIASKLDDTQATEIFKLTQAVCQRINCECFSNRFSETLDTVLVQAIERGHLKLVRLLLPYSHSRHRLLSAAIRSNMNEMVQVVLASGPDIDAPAHTIHLEGWKFEDEDYLYSTTSYAEAIMTRNNEFMRMLESKTGLKNLKEGQRFRPAITAAAKIGDVSYIRKLLSHCPSPRPSDMTIALVYAIENNHEEIISLLIAAGAEVTRESGSAPDPLLAAMLQRNDRMVRLILNLGIRQTRRVSLSSGIETSALQEAVKLGDISIIEDMKSALPDLTMDAGALLEVLTQENTDIFSRLVQLKLVKKTHLTICLETALQRKNLELVGHLLMLDTNPGVNSIPLSHGKEHRKMLQSSSENTHWIRTLADRFYPTWVLIAAIRQGRPGFEAVDMLIRSNLIDIEGYCGIYSSTRSGHISPLGVAIQLSQDGDHEAFFVIKRLLEAGCDPNDVVLFPSRHGDIFDNQTALLEAIETKDTALVRLMIEKGAHVNKTASLGITRTPLQKAVEVESIEIVKLLIKAKADVNGKPAIRGGATALQLAAIRGNCNIAAVLIYHGADLDAQPSEYMGRWPLEGAAEHGRFEMIHYLRSIHVFNKEQCRRAMKLAEENGHLACRDVIAELLPSDDWMVDNFEPLHT